MAELSHARAPAHTHTPRARTPPPLRHRRSAGTLTRFILASCLVALATGAAVALQGAPARDASLLFLAGALLSTTALLHAPAAACAAWRAFLLRPARGKPGALRRGAGHALAAGACAWCLALGLLLLADLRVFKLYGFHINGFVVNLLLTPGGIESLGAGRSTYLSAGALALLYLLGYGALLAAARWSARRDLPHLRVSPLLGASLIAVVLGERAAYAVGQASGRTSILLAAEDVPFYVPLTARGLAQRLGLSAAGGDADLAAATRLDYPTEPLAFDPAAPDLDVVWLVSESLRADMLDPEIMPATWAFSERAARFEHHISGGNGTRMGMFSQFYGLPGAYWFSFLKERRGPALIARLIERGYDLHVSTSARFTYPEFDSTIFADVPPENLVEVAPGDGWERDRKAVDALAAYLERPADGRPRFAFHFFEAPHAPYTFPPEAAIRRPYPEDVDYARLDPERDREGLWNRYVNACHYLDSQIARVLEALERSGNAERTIVVITGDHGEEFMEHGYWGHGSTFAEEQVHVPLVVRIPGRAPLVAGWRTSHVDLPPTVLGALGLRSAPETFSTGRDLWDGHPGRFVVLADWSRAALADDRFKHVVPARMVGFFRSQRLTADDQPTDSPDFAPWSRERLPALLEQMSRFRTHGAP